MKKDSYNYFINGPVTLGIGFGVVSLLSRWVTGNTILSSPETLIKYGLTGGIGYSLMGALALIFFGFLAKKIRDSFPGYLTIGDVLKDRLTPAGYWFMLSILLLTSFYSLFVQAVGVGILIHMIFSIPVFFGMAVFMLFCFYAGGVGGLKKIHQLAGVNVAIVFAAVIIIPVYFYIQEGVHPVYEGIKLYHPYILYFKNKEALWFILTAILIGFGQVITDRATWQRAFIIQKEKVRLTFTLAGLLWATIPLAMSSLLMIIIFGRSYENIYSLIFELVDKIQSTVLIILFVLFCFSAISSAINAELHATTTLFVRNIVEPIRALTDKERWKVSLYFSGAVSFVLFAMVSFREPEPLELIFFIGNIYSALISPMLCIIFSEKTLPVWIPLSSLLGTVCGYLINYQIGNLGGIWVSFLASSLICLFVLFIGMIREKTREIH